MQWLSMLASLSFVQRDKEAPQSLNFTGGGKPISKEKLISWVKLCIILSIVSEGSHEIGGCLYLTSPPGINELAAIPRTLEA